MDAINVPSIIAVFSAFGPIGLIVLIWYFDMRALRKQSEEHRREIREQQEKHREQVAGILAAYKDDMAEIRRMYENNVKLVEGYEGLAIDLKDIVILNTQQMTQLSDEIRQNEYCPMRRVEKKQVIQETAR